MTTAGEETKRSGGVLVEEPSPESQQYDSEIKPDRPMLDVVQITLDAFFQRSPRHPLTWSNLAGGPIRAGGIGETSVHTLNLVRVLN